MIFQLLKTFVSQPGQYRSGQKVALQPRLDPSQRQTAFDNLRLAFRMENYDAAEQILNSAADPHRPDAEYFNLLGVLYERRREWRLAKKFYGRAIRTNRRYAPARENMRRIYEFMTLGHSAQPIAMGDERPALGKLILERAQHRDVAAGAFAKATS